VTADTTLRLARHLGTTPRFLDVESDRLGDRLDREVTADIR
jgi:plasmid maintenance system antidote protein VapI